jgi:hypothetical protein
LETHSDLKTPVAAEPELPKPSKVKKLKRDFKKELRQALQTQAEISGQGPLLFDLHNLIRKEELKAEFLDSSIDRNFRYGVQRIIKLAALQGKVLEEFQDKPFVKYVREILKDHAEALESANTWLMDYEVEKDEKDDWYNSKQINNKREPPSYTLSDSFETSWKRIKISCSKTQKLKALVQTLLEENERVEYEELRLVWILREKQHKNEEARVKLANLHESWFHIYTAINVLKVEQGIELEPPEVDVFPAVRDRTPSWSFFQQREYYEGDDWGMELSLEISQIDQRIAELSASSNGDYESYNSVDCESSNDLDALIGKKNVLEIEAESRKERAELIKAESKLRNGRYWCPIEGIAEQIAFDAQRKCERERKEVEPGREKVTWWLSDPNPESNPLFAHTDGALLIRQYEEYLEYERSRKHERFEEHERSRRERKFSSKVKRWFRGVLIKVGKVA